MFCAYCGTKLEDGSVFCSNCGKKTIDSTIGSMVDHTTESTEDSSINSAVDSTVVESTVNSTLDSTVDSTINNTINNTVDSTVDSTINNTVDSTEVDSTINNSTDSTETIEVGLEVAGLEVEREADNAQVMPNIPTEESTIDRNVEESTKQIDYQLSEQAATNDEGFATEVKIDMRACSVCGTLLEHDSVFCSNCGSRVTAVGQELNLSNPNGYINPVETHMASSGISEEEQLSLTKNDKKQKAKSKKRLIIAAAIMAVLLLGLGGFFIYTKVTLGNLEDRVIAFENLVIDKGLEGYEEYAALIKEAKEKAEGWNVFGVSELEDRLLVATKDCESLSQELASLMIKKSDYENLGLAFIMDSSQENTILNYLENFDTAIAMADAEKAKQILTSLATEKTSLITDNQIYLDSLLQDLYNYENPDFTPEDWEEYNDQVTLAEYYMNNFQFIQARDQIYYCEESRADIEQRIITEKEAATIALLYAKPETLNVMISDVIYNDTSYRYEFEQALEAELGIDVIFEQYEADSYYDAVNTVFASNTMPDVVYLSQDMYKEFQSKGYLLDITQYWQESSLLGASNYYGEDAMERLKIDGKIYGFTPVRGYTSVTYIRQSWLEELGLSVPTNYEEFYQMLVAFTENKMGENNSSSYGMTAPGFLYNSEPYTSFLQEFYQDAVPEIYQASNGEWVDGFDQQEMVDALYRLQDAYNLGLLDQSMANRSVMDAISEFGSGKCGVISLWEGDGADYLINELKKNGIENDIIVMEPLAEMGGYIGKEPAVFALTTKCENPGGVMKYFFEPMLDGGTVQKLWTYGVEGYHWSSAEMSEDTSSLSNLNNQLVVLPYEGMDEITYNYNFIDPLRALATLDEIDPGISQISDLAAISASIANQYYEASPNVKYNETYWYYFGEIQAAREEAVTKVMLDGYDPYTAIEEYKYNVQYIMDQVLSEMNQLSS